MERIMAIFIILGISIVAFTGLAAWWSFLSFCRWLVSKTNNAEDLRHAATAARAFRGAAPAAIAQVLAKLVFLIHGKGV
jgi:hypothetical protein